MERLYLIDGDTCLYYFTRKHSLALDIPSLLLVVLVLTMTGHTIYILAEPGLSCQPAEMGQDGSL